MVLVCILSVLFFFFKQKTAYELRISDWSSDVCSSDLVRHAGLGDARHAFCPGKGCALGFAEQIAAFLPCLQQRKLLDRDSLPDEVAGVHVEAVGAVVDLRDP